MTELSTDKILIMHSITPVLIHCGNSYANAYTECFLKNCTELGVYKGKVIGKIEDLIDDYEIYLESIGGLPEIE